MALGRYFIAISIMLSLYRYSSAQPGNFSVGCFHGLNDTDSAATIGDCQAQDALNVEPNKSGTAIKKRKGYSREASLTVTTSPVNGSHVFYNDAGDKIQIVCNDRHCSKSVNDVAPSIFLSTASAGVTRWSIVDVDGDAYLANDKRDKIAIYDGTTLLYSTGIPQGTILEMTNDRLAVSDTSANPNRVCYSASGRFTTFSTETEEVGSWCDDLGAPGDRVTGLKFDSGLMYIFKTRSITVCELGNQYTTKCDILATYVGTKDPASIITTPSGIMFKGDDGHFWIISRGKLTNLSKNITTIINTQASGTQRNNTQNGASDWEAGTETPANSWDTTTLPGSIFPSSTTLVDGTTNSFNAGTLTNLYINSSDQLQLSSTTASDDFADGNYTSGPMYWEPTLGTWYVDASRLYPSVLDPTLHTIRTSSFTVDHGMWTFSHMTSRWRGCNVYTPFICFSARFVDDGTNYYAAELVNTSGSAAPDTLEARLYKNVGTTRTLLSSSTISYDIDADIPWIIERSVGGKMSLYVNGDLVASATDTSVSGSTTFELQSAAIGNGFNFFSDFYFYQNFSSGTFVSKVFDTGFSTPTGGVFHSTTSTKSGETAIVFSIRQSTSPNNDVWGEWQATSDSLHIPFNQRYWQWKSTFTTSLSTITPTLTAASLSAVTTGQYQSQCIQPGDNISAWGILSCAETTAGAGALSYEVRSGTTCTTISTAAWSSQGNNATITIDTAAAFEFRFTSMLGSTTDQAQVDACTVYWNEGTVAPPTWGVYDSANNNAFFAIATNDATTNNKFLRYNLDLDSWVPWDLSATAPVFKDHYLYFGSASGGYWNKYGLTDSDNGSDITSYWKSKDWGAGEPFKEKKFVSVSSVLPNQRAGSVTVTYIDSQGETGSYAISIGTDSTKAYIRNNYYLPPLSPSTFLNVKYGNSTSRFWELDGYRLDYSVDAWRPLDQ